MNYIEKLQNAVRASRSVLCAGLDPVPEQLPPEIRSHESSVNDTVITFCRRVIEQTKTRVAAYKLNLAYFESLGTEAFVVLNEVLDAIPPGKIIIADIKRGDVPHTNARYKAAYFDYFGFDAVTLSPFMGFETMTPFLDDETRAVYALTLTSNPGADDLMTRPFGGAGTLSEFLAGEFRKFSVKHPGTLGMVIGATRSEQYVPVMQAFPEAPLLIPGIGTQGGSIAQLTNKLTGHAGIPLVNVSRGLSAYDPSSNESWDLQIAGNTGRFSEALDDLTQRYLANSGEK